MNYIASPRGKGRYNRSFRKRENQRAAKERKRLNPEPPPDEPEYVAPMLPRVKFATFSIAIGRERISFRVSRFSPKKLVCRGRIQAASSIGRRIALTLEAML